MGEHLFYTQKVIGSIPITPTKKNIEKNLTFSPEFGIMVVKEERFEEWVSERCSEEE